MASTTSIASNATSASGTSLSAQPNGAARPATKSTSSMKVSDGGRKQTAGPNEASQKRAPAPKAWTSTVNPITQKNISQAQQNGNTSQQKPVGQMKASSSKESIGSDKHAHDRLTFILAASTGLQVSILTTSGDKFEGVFTGSTFQSSETNFTTKMTKRIPSGTDARTNGVTDQSSAFTGSGPDFAMVFEVKDIAEVSLPSLNIPEMAKPQNGASTGFRTDADISGAVERGERPLQPWIPDAGEDVDMSLESAGSAGWDQFEANNRLFGTNSTFDEHLYTTRIDRSAPSYRERERQAAKLAREIEGTTSTNSHMREERGHAWENDGEDEEDKYSGVRRDDLNFPPLQSGLSNKYTPPARRAPTGQPTVAGAPVDPAIISAQVSRPESAKSTMPKSQPVKDSENVHTEAIEGPPVRVPSPAVNPEPIIRSEKKVLTPSTSTLSVDQGHEAKEKGSPAGSSISSQRKMPENATEDVENKLLNQFKAFAASEKMRVHQSQRTRASNDRQAKLKELLSFSETFKLRTPVPADLVGILAKDPAKQEQIVEKARKEHEELPAASTPASHPVTGGEAKLPSRPPAVGKFDPSMVPAPIPDRQTFNRNRQGYPAAPARNERGGPAQAAHQLRGGLGFGIHRSAGLSHERRPIPPQSIPTPIPIHEGRVPPLGPLADQSGLSSPQRSSVHTPTSAVSTKFNAKASEFKPTAPAFTPAGTSIAPSSPKPIEPTRSISGTASPSSFFGAKKPRPATERPSIGDHFNPIPRMKREVEQQKEQTKKDYANNGGIPPAYNTPPRWDVAERNQDRTYKDVFDRLVARIASPAPSARSVAQQIPYQPHMAYHLSNGGTPNPPQVHTPHHAMPHPQPQHQHNHYEDGHARMQMGNSPQVFPSPRLGAGQMVYPPAMAHPNPMQYGQTVGQYMPAQGGPSPVHVRQYPPTPQFMHAQTPQMGAQMMAHQPSNGPYMGIPQQQYQHLPMYSPNPGQAYLQHAASQPHSGYPSPSPSRAAPMMMHQGSQQGHHGGQHLYGMPAQPAQMGYGQYGQPTSMRGGYPGQHTPYGTSPGQAYHYPPQPQRTMSSGYGGGYPGKIPMQHMQPSQGPSVMNGAPQQGGYPSQDVPVEMAK